MTVPRPQVFVENLPSKLIAEAILRPYNAEVVNRKTASDALSTVEFSLLEEPERPVALLVNTDTEDPIEVSRMRDPANRILFRASPSGWVVALAIPRLDAWAMTDPRIRKDLEAFPVGKTPYADRAARIAELTRTTPFDPTELVRTSADFRKLVDFLQAASAGCEQHARK